MVRCLRRVLLQDGVLRAPSALSFSHKAVPLATPHPRLAVSQISIFELDFLFQLVFDLLEIVDETGTPNALSTLSSEVLPLCLSLWRQGAVGVLPFFGDGAHFDFSLGIDKSSRDDVGVGGDAREETETAWDVGAGDGEYGEADAEGDEEGEDEGPDVHLDISGREVVSWFGPGLSLGFES